MKIDFEHWRGSEIADIEKSNLNLESALILIERLKPKFSIDGNQYCFVLGEFPNCLAGFGDTVNLAVLDFERNFFNNKIKKNEN